MFRLAISRIKFIVHLNMMKILLLKTLIQMEVQTGWHFWVGFQVVLLFPTVLPRQFYYYYNSVTTSNGIGCFYSLSISYHMWGWVSGGSFIPNHFALTISLLLQFCNYFQRHINCTNVVCFSSFRILYNDDVDINHRYTTNPPSTFGGGTAIVHIYVFCLSEFVTMMTAKW